MKAFSENVKRQLDATRIATNQILGDEKFEQIANHLRAMQPEMKRLGDAIEPVLMADVAAYIHEANLVQCKHIVDALVERVSSLIGEARELEDASCVIAREIECEEREAI